MDLENETREDQSQSGEVFSMDPSFGTPDQGDEISSARAAAIAKFHEVSVKTDLSSSVRRSISRRFDIRRLVYILTDNGSQSVKKKRRREEALHYLLENEPNYAEEMGIRDPFYR